MNEINPVCLCAYTSDTYGPISNLHTVFYSILVGGDTTSSIPLLKTHLHKTKLNQNRTKHTMLHTSDYGFHYTIQVSHIDKILQYTITSYYYSTTIRSYPSSVCEGMLKLVF